MQGAGFPADATIDAIFPSPFDSADVYLLTEDEAYRTRDGGVHWSTVHGPGHLYDVTFDPLQPEHIYAARSDGEYISRDNGVSWVKGRGPAGSVVASRGRQGLAYLLAGSNVVYRTVDGGLSWQPWDGGDLRADDTVVELAGDVR